MFWSWHADIEAHIMDHNLDNSAALQLIKDQTLESACHEVEYQLNLCGGVIDYCELLKHLSVTFQGERMRQIFLRSSIVKHKSQRSLKKPLWMSSSCSPIR